MSGDCTIEFTRILVYGVTGSGKSTLASQIAEITALPVVLVDDLMWEPNWREVPTERQRSIIQPILDGEEWVMDTAYGKWIDLALARAQLVVFLDYPRWFSFLRLLRRTLVRAATRERCCNGNVESWRMMFSRDSILLWHFRSFSTKKRRMIRLAQKEDAPQVVFFRSQREAAQWLAGRKTHG